MYIYETKILRKHFLSCIHDEVTWLLGKADLEEQLKSTCNGLETELKEVIETNKTLGLANDDFSRRLDATQTKLGNTNIHICFKPFNS